MDTIQSQVIRNECIAVDDKAFVDCELIDCLIEYSGGSIVFERTVLSGCRFVFFGPARGTVHFLQGVGLIPDATAEWCEIPDLVH